MSGEPKKTGSAAPSQKSKVVKRSVMIDGHQTSVSLEDDFWVALHEISAAQGVGISELAATIDHSGGSPAPCCCCAYCLYGHDDEPMRQAVRWIVPRWSVDIIRKRAGYLGEVTR